MAESCGTDDVIGWAILGTGNIAHQFAKALASLPDAELAAVCSRHQDTALAFCREFGVRQAYWDVEEFANDPSVDVVYVATPHAFHHRDSRRCLRAGKAVLCEKPLAVDASQAAEMIATARDTRRFLMEAMWTRFLPAMHKVQELLAAKRIGEVQMVTADFGFRADFSPESRLFNPDLGGGALLDVGVYCVSLASQILGPATYVSSLARIGETNVDKRLGFVLANDSGGIGVFAATITAETPQQAVLVGSEGRITIHTPWWRPDKVTLSRTPGDEESFWLPFEGNGYGHEAAEVMRCLRAGRLESGVMPLDESLSIMKTMDAIRAHWRPEGGPNTDAAGERTV